MKLRDATANTSPGNPVLRALVKQIAALVAVTCDEEARLRSVKFVIADSALEQFDQEIDQRWQTIENLADRLFHTPPHSLADASAQAAVALALSNSGAWDEDYSLTAAARTLAAKGPIQQDDPALAEAVRKLENARTHLPQTRAVTASKSL